MIAVYWFVGVILAWALIEVFLGRWFKAREKRDMRIKNSTLYRYNVTPLFKERK